ncbi:MAG: 6-phosphofructokinase [Candidatus Glassbacteria bacterium RIFCSPLOWO2_12_FULL_58_11]|uniref:Pyrophosphate--fructose 6-phosphate 1-phosphotransferase n=2 Tax=Candidatus Glassiibacteriota TaxID=1817805 RepID=A0A1F5YPY5_9BACT|nr:MAG: 6-phosphofructokinase [Candidatus Glassbacteria bacterium GWA2_58_10]OGG02047.1 MAG: 6-phosphofructokinase [Candidatus Glassbacteria bacterium RIFCSPLOWO2_12_FULL_58_11]
MSDLKGNCLVAQSGGPTAVINASVCGVIQEALAHREIEGIYGAYNGILGVLKEELLDLRAEDPEAVEMLKSTPSAALGSCRHKLKNLAESRRDYERVLEVFKAHNIRYFFYIGGNDSMDTAAKLKDLSAQLGYEMAVMGVPKTIDNDLAFTDHCPGYGSVAKYIAVSAMEAGRDTESLYTFDTCAVLETMGRNAGWITAAAALARRYEEDAPHLVYVPEVSFSREKFIEDVRAVHAKYGRCFIAASEGMRWDNGRYVTEDHSALAKDSFGHAQLGGVAQVLKHIIEKELGLKTRWMMQGLTQRNAMHFASRTDRDEAWLCGAEAVRQAVSGVSGFMVTLERAPHGPYRVQTGLAKLEDVANGEKKLPREWMNEQGNFPTAEFLDYARPLIEGEVELPMAGGLPMFMRFRKEWLVPKCQPYKVG